MKKFMVLPQMNASLIISILSLIMSFIAIIATYFINRKLSSDNDKRKEFNETVEPILEWMEKQEDMWSRGTLAFSPMHWDEKMNKIKRRISPYSARKLDKLLKSYELAFEYASENRSIENCRPLIIASANLRSHLRIR